MIISELWKLTKGKQQAGKCFFFFFFIKNLYILLRIVEFFGILAWDGSQPVLCQLSEVLAGLDILKKPAASVLVLISSVMFNSVRTHGL